MSAEDAAKIETLRRALAGLLGLTQLLLARRDFPADAEEAILQSHRMKAARDALAETSP